MDAIMSSDRSRHSPTRLSGATPSLLKWCRYLIRPLIQRTIGQRSLADNDRYPVWIVLDALFKQLIQRSVCRVGRVCSIPGDQLLFLLVLTQQIDIVNPPLRIGDHGCKHGFEVTHHPLYR